MNVILFGATGMVGQGVLRECMLDPALKALFPNGVTTTEQVGRAMLAVARSGFSKPVLETRDINGL